MAALFALAVAPPRSAAAGGGAASIAQAGIANVIRMDQTSGGKGSFALAWVGAANVPRQPAARASWYALAASGLSGPLPAVPRQTRHH
jgi:hypothetical protein